jgi:hypothetical protein
MWTSARAERLAARAPIASTNSEDTGASVLPVPRSMPELESVQTWTNVPAALVAGTLFVQTCRAALGAPARQVSMEIHSWLALVSCSNFPNFSFMHTLTIL